MRLYLLLFALCMFSMVKSNAQPAKFSKPSHFNDLHTVYTYEKSNWDGTHPSTIFLYVADSNKLESFKWSAGDESATLVTAWIDWSSYSIRRFENHRLQRSKDAQLVAELEQDGNLLRYTVMGKNDSMVLDNPHWQSYDFDFAGLGFSWRALSNKQDGFSFHIADAAFKDNTVSFVNKGDVFVKYEGVEIVNGKSCLKYDINGKGLMNKGGKIWINPSSFMIELYKIELPDEEGFVNGMLKLIQTSKLSTDEWKRFIAQKMAE